MFADKLADEQRLVGDSGAAEATLGDLDGQVKQVRCDLGEILLTFVVQVSSR